MHLIARQTGLAAGLLAGLLLAGCTPGVPYSRQALAIGALVDPVLEPVRGCEALNGEWRNEGEQFGSASIKSALLAGAIELTDQAPEAAFADRVRLEMQDDGALLLTALDKNTPVGSRRIAAENIQCGAESALLGDAGRLRVSVDTRGVLWIQAPRGLLSILYGYRFLPADSDTAGCSRGRAFAKPAPDGLATVVVGVGDHQATVTTVDEALPVVMVQAGKTSRAEVVYLLPGEHRFQVLVWTPGNFWTDRPQATVSTRARLDACHVYVPVGWHRAGIESGAALVDLGPDFDRSCVSTATAPKTAIQLSADARRLRVNEHCFRPQGSMTPDAPPREIPIPGRGSPR